MKPGPYRYEARVHFYAYVFLTVASIGTEIITVRVILLGKVVSSLFTLDIGGWCIY